MIGLAGTGFGLWLWPWLWLGLGLGVDVTKRALHRARKPVPNGFQGDKPAAICPWAGFPLPAAPRNPSPDFATALIAAKPEKPCDGGVFGALNSLSKKE